MYEFDAIVIGSGMGGGASARALAEAGRRVLVLEYGRNLPQTPEVGISHEVTDPEARLAIGNWPHALTSRIDGREARIFAPLGSGTGGTSVFYAATLERPAVHDFQSTPDLPHPTGGWPITWDEMAPWFDRVQAQYRVHGEADPLDPRPSPALLPSDPISAVDEALFDHLRGNGVHPYRLHSAMRSSGGVSMKMDGRSAGLEPALATGNVTLLTEARVLRLIADHDQVTAVEYEHEGRLHRASARHVVLAAGAYASAGILRASISEAWPQGLGNRHDLLGRKLMFHLSEKFALWLGSDAKADPAKTLALRDFYAYKGERFGMVQSMGLKVAKGEILHFLRMRALERGHTSRFWREALRLPANIAVKLFGYAALFDGQLEDLPDLNNRLLLSPTPGAPIAFTYTTAPEAEVRRQKFRQLIRHAFSGKRLMFISDRADPNLGHPCGTLGMGHDEASSVTNRDGRLHGVRNLWVADASVFATSMGVNPSMTIAALAMRQASRIPF